MDEQLGHGFQLPMLMRKRNSVRIWTREDRGYSAISFSSQKNEDKLVVKFE